MVGVEIVVTSDLLLGKLSEGDGFVIQPVEKQIIIIKSVRKNICDILSIIKK